MSSVVKLTLSYIGQRLSPFLLIDIECVKTLDISISNIMLLPLRLLRFGIPFEAFFNIWQILAGSQTIGAYVNACCLESQMSKFSV